MYDPDIHSVRSGNYHTLTLVTPVAQGGGGTTDYNKLTNKPSINGHTLIGDSSLEDIGLGDLPTESLSIEDLEAIIAEDFPDAPSEPLTPEDLEDITR